MSEAVGTMPFDPDWISPPGDTIADLLDERSWTQADFAVRLGASRKFVNQLVSGDASINEATALRLERVLGSSTRFWLSREADYRAAMAKLQEIETLQNETPWLDEIPVRSMRRLGWIGPHRGKPETVSECLRFFGVGSVEAWRGWADGLKLTAYRMSGKAGRHFGSIAAWLRYGELRAEKTDCAPYSADAFRSRLPELRVLALETDPRVFMPRLRSLCAEAGVAVVFAPTPEGCPASGATRWLSPQKALLMLSLRYKTNDQLWFSLFHEAGHILRHGKKKIFLEFNHEAGQAEEKEADRFAANLLIPPKHHQELFSLGSNKRKVVAFAERIGVPPGIVVGRLQHEGLVPYTHLNGLKVRYRWK